MMHYGLHNDQEQGNSSPRKQHMHSSCFSPTFMTGKIDQGSVTDDWQAGAHYFDRKRISLSSVQFDLEKTNILQYDAYEADGESSDDNCCSFYSSSRSEEVSFKANTDRVIQACRQELLDDVEDVNVSSYGRQRRDRGIKTRFVVEHLISSVSIKKNMSQILARKQVVRAVLDEQARQRRCNRSDQTLIAMTSMAHSRDSIRRAHMIGLSHQDQEVTSSREQSSYP